jgi:hypothetical protein
LHLNDPQFVIPQELNQQPHHLKPFHLPSIIV